MNFVLRLENVHKALGIGLMPLKKKPVLKGVSFEVARGEIFGFLGPNGAGKTTAIKLILSLLQLDKGKITLFDEPHTKIGVRRKVGFLPENPYFYEYLTGREFLEFYGALADVPSAERKKRAENLLEKVGLEKEGETQLRKYSRGMLQRIGLAQALVGDPEFVILDEPMSGLDPFGRRDVRELILELKSRGKTVFFSSHILQDAEMLCDRVAILKDGVAQTFVMKDLKADLPIAGYEVVCTGAQRENLGGFNVSFEKDGAIMLSAENGEEKDRIVAFITNAGGKIESLMPKMPSLEKLFLDVFKTEDSQNG